MLVLNKKSKIFLYIIIFVLLVLGGFAVEHFEKDAFVMETVATEDYIPYESDTKKSPTVKSISIPQIQNSL